MPVLSFADADTAADQAMSSYDIFTPPMTDKSINYLGQVFGTVGGVIHGTSGQLLAELFRVFNYAMVILASCMLIYTVVMSVLNTAHEGEFMGKQINSGWAIIRAVTGIGILVPKYTGYSLIQVFIMWVTVQGIGLADKAWTRAIDYLANEGGVVYVEPAQTLSSDGGMVKTFDVANQIFNSEVCMYKLQDMSRKQQTDANEQLKNDPGNTVYQALARQSYPQYRPVWNDSAKTVSFGFPSSNESTQSVCGQFSWRKAEGQEDYYQQYMKIGLQQMVTNITPVAKSVADASSQTLTTSQTKNLKDRAISGLLGATADYENLMRPALQRATRTGQENWKANLEEAKTKGWIVAGSYYWDLAKVNNKLSSDLKNYQPTIDSRVTKDKLDSSGVDGGAVVATIQKANKDLAINDVADLLKVLEDKVGTALPPEAKANLLEGINNLTSSDQAKKNAALKQVENMTNQMMGVTGKPEKVFSGSTMAGSAGMIMVLGGSLFTASPALAMILAGGLGSLVGVWFGVMNSPGDPIAMVQQLGQGMVGIAIAMWIIGSAALALMTGMMSIMGSATGAGFGIQNGLKLFVPIVVGFIGVLFVNGMVLSVYVPMIPFMIFTFAAIGWLISVLEAIVAGPLVAAHLTRPEGHDLLGKAEQAVMLLLGVFLRPVVMVIGFLAAIIISRVALRIVNAGFNHAVDSAGPLGITASGTNLFGIAGVMIVYTMIVISIINLVFNAGVVKLWETIWMWVGFHQPNTSTEQAMQEVKGGLHSGAQAMGDTTGGLVKAGAETRASQLEQGQKGLAGGLARDEKTGKWGILSKDLNKGDGSKIQTTSNNS